MSKKLVINEHAVYAILLCTMLCCEQLVVERCGGGLSVERLRKAYSDKVEMPELPEETEFSTLLVTATGYEFKNDSKGRIPEPFQNKEEADAWDFINLRPK